MRALPYASCPWPPRRSRQRILASIDFRELCSELVDREHALRDHVVRERKRPALGVTQAVIDVGPEGLQGAPVFVGRQQTAAPHQRKQRFDSLFPQHCRMIVLFYRPGGRAAEIVIRVHEDLSGGLAAWIVTGRSG